MHVMCNQKDESRSQTDKYSIRFNNAALSVALKKQEKLKSRIIYYEVSLLNEDLEEKEMLGVHIGFLTRSQILMDMQLEIIIYLCVAARP